MKKNELRKNMKEKLSLVSEGTRRNKTEKIHHHLFRQGMWKSSEVVGVTVSVGGEIDTYSIISQAWNEGKKVVIPKCIPKTRELVFYMITSLDDLEDSFFGLKEPKVEKCSKMSPKEISLLIVPGLIFDKKGYRIGHGGGYYDRFLEKGWKGFHTCSICFDFQVVSALPSEKHDIPVQLLVTDVEVIEV